MLTCLKLPLSFEPEGLRSDLDGVAASEWVRHFNDRYYEGEWSGVALRTVSGDSSQIYADPASTEDLTDTPLLARSPALQGAIDALRCPVKSARLLKLGPGARILEHRDYNLSLEDGEVRLHVPITTDPRVEFYLNGKKIDMLAGECWYINANLPHKVNNLGDTARVHMVIDCVVDDWLRGLVASVSPPIETPQPLIERTSSPVALLGFCHLVFEDVGLQERLRQTSDRKLFTELVVGLGEEHGFHFNSEDVAEALRANRHVWIARWV